MDAMAAEAARARRLERERDELRRQLEKLHSRLVSSGGGARVSDDDLETRVQTLEAQLDAFFTHTDPYTPAELALFQAPRRSEPIRPLLMAQADSPAPATNAATESRPANTNAPANTQPTGASSPSAAASPQGGAPSTRKTEKDLPPGAGPLAMQAQRAFRMRRFDEAEQAYREILKLDENNVFTLGNLAAILVEQGRIDQGEEFTQRALALDPDDPFCLSLLGIIRFRQERYEDAFEALSRSAQLDPTNADTQNYLGITLSQRGQRKAAEAALRKALKLNPSSPSAHYNLAVVYATQKPPFLELAKYHYEKARRAGQPANPAFEAILNGNASPEGKSGNE